MHVKRLLIGLSLLSAVVGLLLVCLIPGGLVNRTYPGYGNFLSEHGIFLDRAGHIVGFCFLGLAAIGFIVVFSLKKAPPPDGRLPPRDERFTLRD